MGKYYNSLNDEIKEYFKILSSEFPEWLEEYIQTDEMYRIGQISMSCGMDYSKFFNVEYWYSNLEHSVAVALIIWNFTHDKKQTLAGLFHDIATPVFKHCIDFMNGDSENQESTEEKTADIIKGSKKIMQLLEHDGIDINEVCDYKIYPLADNATPMLSADRFEYNFSSGLTFFRVWDLDKIKTVYSNIEIVKNEGNLDEFAFTDKKVCESYIRTLSKLWPQWVSDQDKISMMFLADMCKSLNKIDNLSIDELYTLSENNVIERFETCQDKYIVEAWNNFKNCDKVIKSSKPIDDKYCVKIKTKTRYLNPLVIIDGVPRRIYDVSKEAKSCIDNFLNQRNDNDYICFDFGFKPY